MDINLTETQLLAMTKAQLVTEITKDRTTTLCTKSVDCKDGQVSREYVTRDIANAITQTDQWGWTYKDGIVFEIAHVVLDGKGVVVLSEKIVKDGGGAKLVPLKDVIKG
jgi:hypothetical protein